MRCPRFHSRLLIALTAVLLLGMPPARVWAKPHAKHVAKDELLALENQWVKAQLQGDAAAMDKLLSPDFLGITASGAVVTKAQQLERMRTRTIAIRSLQISDVRIKLLGQHAASVTSLAQLDGISEGRPLVGSFRYTHVYQKLPNGVWKITNFEATHVPESGARGSMGETSP